MDRDGHQGWSRASEAGWQRAFGERAAQLAEVSPHVRRLMAATPAPPPPEVPDGATRHE